MCSYAIWYINFARYCDQQQVRNQYNQKCIKLILSLLSLSLILLLLLSFHLQFRFVITAYIIIIANYDIIIVLLSKSLLSLSVLPLSIDIINRLIIITTVFNIINTNIFNSMGSISILLTPAIIRY